MKKQLLACLLFFVPALSFSQNLVVNQQFATNGIASFDLTDGYSSPTGIAEQPDGKILFSTTQDDDLYNSKGLLFRLNANGTLDTGFGIGGVVTPGIRYVSRLRGFGLLQNGNIVTSTYEQPHYDYPKDTIAIQRYLPNGTPDPTFGINGKATIQKDDYNIFYRGFAVQVDGSVLVSFVIEDTYAMVQFTSAGILNMNFGVNGRVFSHSIYDKNIATYISLPNKKILAYSIYTKPDNTVGPCLIRYTAKGVYDSTFGVNGVLVLNNLTTGEGATLALAPNNKLLLYANDNGNDVMLRYNVDGKLDQSFGTNGKIIIAPAGSGYGRGIAIQSNGSIIVSRSGANQLKRLLPNGKSDSTFGTAGTIDLTYFATNPRFATGQGNKLLISGTRYLNEYESEVHVTEYIPCPTCNTRSGSTLIAQKIAPQSLPAVGIKLYPNPATNFIAITGLAPNITSQLTITDAAGKQLLKVRTGKQTEQLDVQHLQPGIYYITIAQGTTQPVVYKFLKQ